LALLTSACLGSPDATPTPIAPGPPATTIAGSPTVAATDTPRSLPATAEPATQTVPPTADPRPPTATPATSDPILLQALQAMANVSSYHYTSTMQTFGGENNQPSTSEGDYRAPDQLHWITEAGTLTTTAVISGDRYLVAVGELGWTALPNAAREAGRQQLWQLIAQGQQVTEVDRDPVSDPIATVHLTFTLPLKNLPFENRAWKLAEGEVWVGQVDRRIYAFKLHTIDAGSETFIRQYLSAFDIPVEITVPTPGSTANGSSLSGQLLLIRRGTDGANSVRVRDLATGAETPVPDIEGLVTAAAWAPGEGTVLASVAGSLVSRDTRGRVLNLTAGLAPAWAPDGKAIAYLRGGRGGAIWTSDPLLNTPHRLTTYLAQQVTYTPDGTLLLFSGWPAGADLDRNPAGLYRLDLAAETVEPVLRDSRGVEAARVSPDGNQLALIVGGHLATSEWDGSGLTLLGTVGLDSDPVWSPDGDTLLYAHQDIPGVPGGIWAYPLPAGPARLLTPGDLIPCDWQP
jgi:hypothetical protein